LRIVALAGGTGSAKLLRGLASLECELTVVANVGDNTWVHGLLICPDIDTAMYTLAGMSDRTHGWGLRGDTFAVLKQLAELGQETWFALGDRDMATHILRTKWLREGRTLTQVTRDLCRGYGTRAEILPVTDSRLETKVLTPGGEMDLQQFWVKKRGRPRVTGVRYDGASEAAVTREVEDSVEKADYIIVCPANPVTSIGPMLSVRGLRKALASARARISALSPMVGSAPFSGPAAKLMKAAGASPDSVGVAEMYSDFLDTIVINPRDRRMADTIEQLGVKCRCSDTRLGSPAAERRIARELLES
jgi:LPPG:FO 2-phospho-L-lactate transferase